MVRLNCAVFMFLNYKKYKYKQKKRESERNKITLTPVKLHTKTHVPSDGTIYIIL